MRAMQRIITIRQNEHAVWRFSQNGCEYPFTSRATALKQDAFALGRQMRAKLPEFSPQA